MGDLARDGRAADDPAQPGLAPPDLVPLGPAALGLAWPGPTGRRRLAQVALERAAWASRDRGASSPDVGRAIHRPVDHRVPFAGRPSRHRLNARPFGRQAHDRRRHGHLPHTSGRATGCCTTGGRATGCCTTGCCATSGCTAAGRPAHCAAAAAARGLAPPPPRRTSSSSSNCSNSTSSNCSKSPNSVSKPTAALPRTRREMIRIRMFRTGSWSPRFAWCLAPMCLVRAPLALHAGGLPCRRRHSRHDVDVGWPVPRGQQEGEPRGRSLAASGQQRPDPAVAQPAEYPRNRRRALGAE